MRTCMRLITFAWLFSVRLATPGSAPRAVVGQPTLPSASASASVSSATAPRIDDDGKNKFQPLINVLVASQFPYPLRAKVCSDLLKAYPNAFRLAGAESCASDPVCSLLRRGSSADEPNLLPSVLPQGGTTLVSPSRRVLFRSERATNSAASGSPSVRAARSSRPQPQAHLRCRPRPSPTQPSARSI